jgi:hypothetical protein
MSVRATHTTGELPMSALLLVFFAAVWSGLLDMCRAIAGV